MADAQSSHLVGVSGSSLEFNGYPIHFAGRKYAAALAAVAGVVPLMIPPLGGAIDTAALVARLDGLVLTGGRANVEPQHYGDDPDCHLGERDPDRDATALPLIRAAIDAGLPVLGVCRGIQEMNVALGGTLHRMVHDVPGRIAHSHDPEASLETKFALAHHVDLRAGGPLAEMAGAPRIQVNSLHRQGIDRPAPGTTVEAVAPDGLIEAISVNGARGAGAFAVGVQWHAEWQALDYPFYRRLFESFGDACRAR